MNKSLFRRIKQSYLDAPNSENITFRLEEILLSEEANLFPFIEKSIISICDFLAINTQILRLSELDNNKDLRGIDRVQDIVKNLGAETYLNPEGGREIYKKGVFNDNDLELEFLEHNPKPYRQLIPGFIDRLSIIDLLYMHEDEDDIKNHLESYQIIKPLEWGNQFEIFLSHLLLFYWVGVSSECNGLKKGACCLGKRETT